MEINNLIKISIEEIINKTSSKEKIKVVLKKHNAKLHFIPKKYRILGGLLQSMNIQFGNFIEVLMKNLLEINKKYEILNNYSGKKNNKFKLPEESERLIDDYITRCQTLNLNIDTEFENLKNKLNNINLKNKKNPNFLTFKHDIDLLFKDKNTEVFYYVEIKYNDDHDTGKFVDINRKFIKTYAYLLNELKITNANNLIPILYFFNNKKMKGNIYIPEEKNIIRGEKFFEKFLTIKYEQINDILMNVSESDETKQIFDKLYEKVMSI